MGTAFETKRAFAVLESITGRRARTRRARSDGEAGGEAAGANGEAGGGESDESGSSNGSGGSSSGSSGATGDDPHGGRIRRRRRAQFRELAGRDATTFEARLLAGDRAAMPACAQAVVDGGERSAEFWVWLSEQFREQKIDGVK
jgi:hypothetical protein